MNLTRRITPLVLALSAGVAAAQLREGDSTSLTIYSVAEPGAVPVSLYRPVPPSLQGAARPNYDPRYGYYPQPQGVPGYAVVRQDRTLDIAKGRSTLTFDGVAALIEPTTVMFASLTDPAGTSVIEQNYQFDLASPQKMLERYVGKQVSIDGIDGELLSASGGVLIREPSGKVRWNQSFNTITFPSLADGMVLKPTLVWDVSSDKGGPQRTRVSYQTEGITWWSDYNFTWKPGKDANAGSLDVGAWVSILNQSGAAYPDAQLKLIAGDVHRAPPPGQNYPASAPARREMAADQDGAGFQEKAFFEYHLYTLGRPATIPENSTKQVELFETARDVPAKKVLVYYGTPGWQSFFSSPATDRDLGMQSSKKVDVYLTFKNSKENGMGMPLPSGRIRVNQLDDAGGSLEFIGEDVIDHTPRDENVLVKMGEAFDVVGERTQTDFAVNLDQDWMTETIEIKIRNHKAEPVDVIVKESLYRWVNWEIVEKSQAFEKQDSRTIHFPVRVEPDKEVTVRYKVKYTW